MLSEKHNTICLTINALQKSQSELIENKDYDMELLLPHNATKIKSFLRNFIIRIVYWLSKGAVCVF